MKKIHYPRPHFERDCFYSLKDGENSFVFPDYFKNDIVLMNCEGKGRVYLNGEAFPAGKGLDVTCAVRKDGENTFRCEGEVSNVWFECVPRIYIKNARITPNLDENKIHVELELSGNTEAAVEVYCGNSMIAAASTLCSSCELAVSECRSWSPEDPFLYDVMLTAGKDVVKTRFGMKKLSVSYSDERAGIFLNNKRFFPVGTVNTDVEAAKNAGFDLIKVSRRMPDGWYARCDKRGMLVWQDSDDNDLDGFVSVALSSCREAGCLVCADDEDVYAVHARMGKAHKGAAIFVCDKKRISSFAAKSGRLAKKGLAGAVYALADCDKSMKKHIISLKKAALLSK